MTKVLMWVKRHYYRWERDDLRKANSFTMWVAFGLIACVLAVMAIGEYFGIAGEIKQTISVVASMFLGIMIGAAFAFRWADEQIKKSK